MSDHVDMKEQVVAAWELMKEGSSAVAERAKPANSAVGFINPFPYTRR